MSNVLSADNLFQSNNRSNRDSFSAEDRPRSELWLNVGVPVNVINPDTGETEQEQLTLPVNLAIDTMREREVPSRKPTTAKAKQFKDRAIASNQMLKALQQAGAKLEPGGSVKLEGFTLMLQRVNERDDDLAGTDPTDNPYLSQIDDVFGIGTKVG